MLQALTLAWPKYYAHFQLHLSVATIVDAKAPIGGGRLGDFTVGIYFSDSINDQWSKYFEKSTGWKPHSSTAGYIAEHYAAFEDPIQAYVNDMVVHELGHLLFGFGITQIKLPKDPAQSDHTNAEMYRAAWFALGLGLVYDRLIWSELGHHTSPMFDSTISVWREKFSHRKDLDQRLVNPDLSNDEKAGVPRLQIYGHGKAFVYLQALRTEIGAPQFDQTVVRYLARPIGSPILYDDFLSTLPVEMKPKIEAVEARFSVR